MEGLTDDEIIKYTRKMEYIFGNDKQLSLLREKSRSIQDQIKVINDEKYKITSELVRVKEEIVNRKEVLKKEFGKWTQ